MIICEYSDIYTILKLQLTDKYHQSLIYKYHFNNIIIHLKNSDDIDDKVIYLNNKFNFYNYDLSNTIITDKSVKTLYKCKYLNLNYCKNVTDESVKLLGNIKYLYLFCCNITDESVIFLEKCHTLSLCGSKITDLSIRKLHKCHNLYLWYTTITEDTLKYLNDNHTSNTCCNNIIINNYNIAYKNQLYRRYGNIDIPTYNKCHTLEIISDNLTYKSLENKCNYKQIYIKENIKENTKELKKISKVLRKDGIKINT